MTDVMVTTPLASIQCLLQKKKMSFSHCLLHSLESVNNWFHIAIKELIYRTYTIGRYVEEV